MRAPHAESHSDIHVEISSLFCSMYVVCTPNEKKIYTYKVAFYNRAPLPLPPSTLSLPPAHPIASPHTYPNTPPLMFASPHPHRPPALRTLKTFFRPKPLLPPRLASRLVGCTRFSLLPAYVTGSDPVGLRILMYVCR